MEVVRFTDGPTRHETWELPDGGWGEWAAVADRFVAHAARAIAAECSAGAAEWLEVNYWQASGRLIVFPSRGGPHGDRGEPVCFELSSAHLAAAARRVGASVPDAEQNAAWAALAGRVWRRVGECLTAGAAGRELAVARASHRLRVAAYDDQPGEGPWRLTESGAFATGHAADAEPDAAADGGA